MATSEAEICNKALARIGHKVFIDDLETDQSEEAEVARLFYADERDSLLMEAPWPFAVRRALLAEVNYTTEPARDGWARIYKLPADLLEPLYIWPGGITVPTNISTPLGAVDPLRITWQNPRTPRADQRIPFAIESASTPDESSILLCDFSPVTLVYTSRLVNVAAFSPLFTDALAWHLGAIFAMPLAVKPEIQSLCEKRAESATQKAIARHFRGQQEDVSPDSEMIMARL
jgi:hypothetical protein